MLTAIMVTLILLLVATGFLTGGTMATAAASSNNDGDNAQVNTDMVPPIPQHIVPTDPKTWPSGDRLWDCCRAIAYAEGYQVPNSNPANLNNPGDISDGRAQFGSEFHSGSNITTFPDALTGWTWLYGKLQNIANGSSHVYDASMSWNEIGAKWAPPNAAVWASNVARQLGVDADSSFADYVNA